MKKKRSYWKLIWPQLYSSATLSKVSVCSVFRHRGKGCIFSPQRYQSDGRSCCLINGCEATTPPFTVPAQNHGAEIFFSTSPFPFPRWKAAIAGAWNWSRHWNTDKQPECGREQGWDQGDVRKAHCAVFVIWRENSYLLCCCGLLPSSVIIFFFFQALERRRVAWQGGCSAIWIVYFQKKSEASHLLCYLKVANLYLTWRFDIVEWSDSCFCDSTRARKPVGLFLVFTIQ